RSGWWSAETAAAGCGTEAEPVVRTTPSRSLPVLAAQGVGGFHSLVGRRARHSGRGDKAERLLLLLGVPLKTNDDKEDRMVKKGLKTESQTYWFGGSYVSVTVTTDDDRCVGLAEWVFHEVEMTLLGLSQEPPAGPFEVTANAKELATGL